MQRQGGIDQKQNFDDVFLRDLSIAFCAVWKDRLNWNYTFDDQEKRNVNVPVYFGMGVNGRFLYDAFHPDIPMSKLELNVDPIPRGVVTLDSISIKSNEFTNPNVMIRFHKDYKAYYSTVKAIPMVVSFELTVLVDSELDIWNVHQAIWDNLWKYKFFEFEHKFMRIDSVFHIPDDFTSEIKRDFSLKDVEGLIAIPYKFDVQTVYPAMDEDNMISASKKIRTFLGSWDAPQLQTPDAQGFFNNTDEGDGDPLEEHPENTTLTSNPLPGWIQIRNGEEIDGINSPDDGNII